MQFKTFVYCIYWITELTWMRKSCISVSAILRPRHWRGPKPKPKLLKKWLWFLSQREGRYCSGRGKIRWSLPIAYKPSCTKVWQTHTCTDPDQTYSFTALQKREKLYKCGLPQKEYGNFGSQYLQRCIFAGLQQQDVAFMEIYSIKGKIIFIGIINTQSLVYETDLVYDLVYKFPPK